MKKRSYRTQPITSLKLDTLTPSVAQQRLIVGIDVAKTDFVAALMTAERQTLALVKWQHPAQTPLFYQLISEQLDGADIELVMEPSGTYGDPLRHWLNQHGYPLFRVSPKRSHDAAEVYDGVPSLHDPKSAMIIARLHLEGASEPWPDADHSQRSLRAAINTLARYDELFYRNGNRLEGLLARHWPELTHDLDLTSATLLELLSAFGTPEQVAQQPQQARALMRRIGRIHLTDDKINHVLHTASTTVGLPALPAERQALQQLATDTRAAQLAANGAKKVVIAAGAQHSSIQALAPVLGQRTAVVLFTLLGPPDHYPNSASYLKAMGLNLKQHSSGKHVGRLAITKRGSSTVRRYLFLATLPLVKKDPLVQLWYQRKVQRDGGLKMKALIALMRKLARALWHVAKGQPFDASKLFDLNALEHA